jgi:hypothetical protein
MSYEVLDKKGGRKYGRFSTEADAKVVAQYIRRFQPNTEITIKLHKNT